jgi:hypothetical protein
MEITKIEKKEDIYFLTKKPNLFEKIFFGQKETVEKYKDTGEVFKYFPSLKAFRRSDGKIASWKSKECEALNNFYNSF